MEQYNALLRFFAGKDAYSADEVLRAQQAGRCCPPLVQQQCAQLFLGEWLADGNGNGGEGGSAGGSSGELPTSSGLRWQWHNNYATTVHAIKCAAPCSHACVWDPLAHASPVSFTFSAHA